MSLINTKPEIVAGDSESEIPQTVKSGILSNTKFGNEEMEGKLKPCSAKKSPQSNKSTRHVSFSASPSVYPVENLSEYNSYEPGSLVSRSSSASDRLRFLCGSEMLSGASSCPSKTQVPQVCRVLDAQPQNCIKSKAIITETPLVNIHDMTLRHSTEVPDSETSCMYETSVVNDSSSSSKPFKEYLSKVPGATQALSADEFSDASHRYKLLYNVSLTKPPQIEPEQENEIPESRITQIKQRLSRKVSPKIVNENVVYSPKRIKKSGSDVTDYSEFSRPVDCSLGAFGKGEEYSTLSDKLDSNTGVDHSANERSSIRTPIAKSVSSSKGAIAALARGPKTKSVKVTPISTKIRIEAPRIRSNTGIPLAASSNRKLIIDSDCESQRDGLLYNQILTDNKLAPNLLGDDFTLHLDSMENESFHRITEAAAEVAESLADLPTPDTSSCISNQSSLSIDSIDTLLTKVNTNLNDVENIAIGINPVEKTVNISNDVSMESIPQASVSEDGEIGKLGTSWVTSLTQNSSDNPKGIVTENTIVEEKESECVPIMKEDKDIKEVLVDNVQYCSDLIESNGNVSHPSNNTIEVNCQSISVQPENNFISVKNKINENTNAKVASSSSGKHCLLGNDLQSPTAISRLFGKVTYQSNRKCKYGSLDSNDDSSEQSGNESFVEALSPSEAYCSLEYTNTNDNQFSDNSENIKRRNDLSTSTPLKHHAESTEIISKQGKDRSLFLELANKDLVSSIATKNVQTNAAAPTAESDEEISDGSFCSAASPGDMLEQGCRGITKEEIKENIQSKNFDNDSKESTEFFVEEKLQDNGGQESNLNVNDVVELPVVYASREEPLDISTTEKVNIAIDIHSNKDSVDRSSSNCIIDISADFPANETHLDLPEETKATGNNAEDRVFKPVSDFAKNEESLEDVDREEKGCEENTEKKQDLQQDAASNNVFTLFDRNVKEREARKRNSLDFDLVEDDFSSISEQSSSYIRSHISDEESSMSVRSMLTSVDSEDMDSSLTESSVEQSVKSVSKIVNLFSNNDTNNTRTPRRLEKKVTVKLRSSIPTLTTKEEAYTIRQKEERGYDNTPGNTNSLVKYKKEKTFSSRKALFEHLEKNNTLSPHVGRRQPQRSPRSHKKSLYLKKQLVDATVAEDANSKCKLKSINLPTHSESEPHDNDCKLVTSAESDVESMSSCSINLGGDSSRVSSPALSNYSANLDRDSELTNSPALSSNNETASQGNSRVTSPALSTCSSNMTQPQSISKLSLLSSGNSCGKESNRISSPDSGSESSDKSTGIKIPTRILADSKVSSSRSVKDNKSKLNSSNDSLQNKCYKISEKKIWQKISESPDKKMLKSSNKTLTVKETQSNSSKMSKLSKNAGSESKKIYNEANLATKSSLTKPIASSSSVNNRISDIQVSKSADGLKSARKGSIKYNRQKSRTNSSDEDNIVQLHNKSRMPQKPHSKPKTFRSGTKDTTDTIANRKPEEVTRKSPVSLLRKPTSLTKPSAKIIKKIELKSFSSECETTSISMIENVKENELACNQPISIALAAEENVTEKNSSSNTANGENKSKPILNEDLLSAQIPTDSGKGQSSLASGDLDEFLKHLECEQQCQSKRSSTNSVASGTATRRGKSRVRKIPRVQKLISKFEPK